MSCSVKTHFRSRVCLRVSTPAVNIGSRKCLREVDNMKGSKVPVVGVPSVLLEVSAVRKAARW